MRASSVIHPLPFLSHYLHTHMLISCLAPFYVPHLPLFYLHHLLLFFFILLYFMDIHIKIVLWSKEDKSQTSRTSLESAPVSCLPVSHLVCCQWASTRCPRSMAHSCAFVLHTSAKKIFLKFPLSPGWCGSVDSVTACEPKKFWNFSFQNSGILLINHQCYSLLLK